MKIFFKVLLLALIVTSCEDVEPTIFNGNDTSNSTFLSFSRTRTSLPIERDATGTLNVTLNASTISNADRVYSVDVITEAAVPADPATYSVPGTVTIPAGSYQGTLTITGVDDGLVDATRKTFFIKLADSSITNENMDANLVEILVYEVCALQAPFTGLYELDQITPGFAPAGGITSFKEGEVMLSIGDSPYDRVFLGEPYPGFSSSTEVILSFACDFVNLGAPINTGIGCEGEPDIIFEPTDSPSMYDTTDDSEFEVTFTENAGGGCGVAPAQTTLRFTKVE